MPDAATFAAGTDMTAEEAYYAALIRELTHWTSAPARCKRDFTQRFGDNAAHMEELVADIATAWICADLGLHPLSRPDHAPYPHVWAKVLRSDPAAGIDCARKAIAAVDYLNRLQTPAPAANHAAESDHLTTDDARQKAARDKAARHEHKGKHWTEFGAVAEMPDAQLEHAKFDYARWLEKKGQTESTASFNFDQYVGFRIKKNKDRVLEAKG